jgi:hypothetical protein
MKRDNIKLSVFIIPLVFLVLGVKYSDEFYYIATLLSFLFCLIFSISGKDKRATIGLPQITLKPTFSTLVQKTKSLKELIIKRRHSPEESSTKTLTGNLLLNKATQVFFVVSTLLFSVNTIFFLPEINSTTHAFLEYYLSYFKQAEEYSLGFAISFLLVISVFLLVIQKRERRLSVGNIAKNASIYFFAVLLGFQAALVVGYLYAFTQVTYIALEFNSGYTKNQIISDTDEIAKRIKSTKSTPEIAYFNFPYKKSLVLLKLRNDSGFYGKTLASSMPDSLYNTINISPSSLYFVNDTLLITELKEQPLEKVSPVLGKVMVKATLKDKNIKEHAKIAILNRQEYLKLREEQINEDIQKLNEGIAEIEREISIAASYVAESRQSLQESENFLANSESNKESLYNECKTAGETFLGDFYRYYSDDECNSFRAEWDRTVNAARADQDEIRSALSHNQNVLSEYQGIREYIVESREFVESTKDMTPHELGIFLPGEEIKIALDSTNPDAAYGYLSTLVHEYLHYTTYVSEEKRLDHFFEEGLTEYFARKIVKQQINYTENVGYPVAVKLIEEITKKIPEDKLLTIYFTKDQKQLEYLLDEAYGKNFYADSSVYFSTINYLPFDESLKAANTVMVRIDGKKISAAHLQ